MSHTINVKVTLRETKGDVTRMIKKFIKKCKKNRIVEECRDRRFFEKPSKKRRRAAKLKKKNARKAELERNKKLDIR
jgi:ribosomal protein S21